MAFIIMYMTHYWLPTHCCDWLMICTYVQHINNAYLSILLLLFTISSF